VQNTSLSHERLSSATFSNCIFLRYKFSGFADFFLRVGLQDKQAENKKM
jgi:hypothetical protein